MVSNLKNILIYEEEQQKDPQQIFIYSQSKSVFSSIQSTLTKTDAPYIHSNMHIININKKNAEQSYHKLDRLTTVQ